MNRWSLGGGVAVLTLVWLGPLPDLARQAFVAHMAMHVAVVALAAPLLALGLRGLYADPAARGSYSAPLAAAVLELVVVWGWHAPLAHRLARHGGVALVAEQGSFLLVGLLTWLTALAAGGERASRAAAGVVALLLTSMHMTLLGALLTLAPRPLYGHGGGPSPGGPTALADQQLGGLLMLAGGGAAYLVGGLCLLTVMLRRPAVENTGQQ